MTKKRLLDWLEREEMKAVNRITEEYEKKRDTLREELYKKVGLLEIATEFHELIGKADTLLIAWQKTNAEDLGFPEGNHHSMRNDLYPHSQSLNATVERFKEREVSRLCPQLKELSNQFSSLRNEVTQNFQAVRANARALKNAKLVESYLEDVGFNLSELRAEDARSGSTALATPVNPAFLFLGTAEKS